MYIKDIVLNKSTFNDLSIALDRYDLLTQPDRLAYTYKLCQKHYRGLLRYSGEPIIKHCLRTALTLANMKQDQVVAEAALIHELPDQDLDLSQFSDLSPDAVRLAKLVHQVGQVQLRGSQSQEFVENLRRMFIVMAQDLRVVYIRLADRLDNIRTLDAVPLSKQMRIAEETIEIYAPLAERFGIGKLKGELEDLAFPYLDPEAYARIVSLTSSHYRHAQQRLRQILILLRRSLVKYNIAAQVSGRQKHLYSLYRKLQRPDINQDISQINDLIAVRIITDDVLACYSILGLVHKLFKPVPYLGLSDFIAQPKPNGYQSIHTRVFDQKGHVFEIQIRTHQMHHIAEFGLAAHATYSEVKNQGATDAQLQAGIKATSQPDWHKLLQVWQEDIQSQETYSGLVARRIYVLSPKGDVYDLPEFATPVDFAAAVHTNLVLHLHSVKVNQKIAKLDSTLKNGDVVEVQKTNHTQKPKKDWLRFVRTNKARYVIKKYM